MSLQDRVQFETYIQRKTFLVSMCTIIMEFAEECGTSDSTRSREEREVKYIDCMMQSILFPLADLGQINVAPDEDTHNIDKRKTSKMRHHC